MGTFTYCTSRPLWSDDFFWKFDKKFTQNLPISAIVSLIKKYDLKIIENAVDKLKSLSGYTFKRKDLNGINDTGLLAQDVRSVLPEVVNENNEGIIEGTEGAELVSSFGPESRDIVVPRLHGLTPFTSTSLDQIIRNLGAKTVIPIGVSINIGILGLVLSAVDLGYQVVVPTDAVAGVPISYGESIMQGTISLLATLTTTEEIVSIWTGN